MKCHVDAGVGLNALLRTGAMLICLVQASLLAAWDVPSDLKLCVMDSKTSSSEAQNDT